jgi:DNA-binding PadR family transcriptional regulator
VAESIVVTRTGRALTEDQERRLAIAAFYGVTASVERSLPSLERRGLAERYWHKTSGRRWRSWRVTAAGRATALRLRYDRAGRYPVYCALCGEGLDRWYFGGRAPMCPACHGKRGPVLHPARWEMDPARVRPAAYAVWVEWAGDPR